MLLRAKNQIQYMNDARTDRQQISDSKLSIYYFKGISDIQ